MTFLQQGCVIRHNLCAYRDKLVCSLIRGRKIIIWSDNTAAEAATREGTARAFDHLSLVHAIWLRAAELGVSLYVKRVPTKDNIADDPSRERWELWRAWRDVQPGLCSL